MNKLLLTIDEAAEVIGISRRKFYDLLLTEEIELVSIGRSRRIPDDALGSYVDKLRRAERCDVA